MFGGSEWFYYSPIFIPFALLLVSGLLAIGYVGGLFLGRFRVSRCAVLAVLSFVILAEVISLFARDGYLLIRYARPRQVAFNDSDPSWFFFAPAERAVGLSYVALQQKPGDSARSKRIFQKALYAADQIPNDNHNLLILVAQAQVKAALFEDAATTILDLSATMGVDYLMLGTSQRTALTSLLRGNVVTSIAEQLPDTIHLVIYG